MNEQKKLRCVKCNAELVLRQVNFNYMGRTFGHEVPVCPVCGKPYISRELASGKMAEVEMLLEDK